MTHLLFPETHLLKVALLFNINMLNINLLINGYLGNTLKLYPNGCIRTRITLYNVEYLESIYFIVPQNIFSLYKVAWCPRWLLLFQAPVLYIAIRKINKTKPLLLCTRSHIHQIHISLITWKSNHQCTLVIWGEHILSFFEKDVKQQPKNKKAKIMLCLIYLLHSILTI